jgi:ferric-dicitrate binding protein FerR (iron transport regulator)
LNQEAHIRELLEKYERHACSTEELRQLEEWLDAQAAAGKPWTFPGEAERQAMKNRMQSAIIAAMGSSETSDTGREPASQKEDLESATPVRGIHGSSGEVRRLLGEVRSSSGEVRRLRTIWSLARYGAAAAAVIGGIWGITWLTRPVREIVLSSASGKVEKAILPDGSAVWLNDSSELVIHTDFASNRRVELRRGEAFFDVKKDPDHVFTVEAGGIRTTVLGTAFSARMNGHNGDMKVSVVTGKVMVSQQAPDGQGKTLGILTAYQRLKYNGSSRMAKVDTVLSDEADGWIRGDIFLQNASLQEVVQWLQDHFNVHIQNNRSTYTGEYYLQAKSDISLPEVIKILNLLGKKDHVQFSSQGKTIIIQ